MIWCLCMRWMKGALFIYRAKKQVHYGDDNVVIYDRRCVDNTKWQWTECGVNTPNDVEWWNAVIPMGRCITVLVRMSYEQCVQTGLRGDPLRAKWESHCHQPEIFHFRSSTITHRCGDYHVLLQKSWNPLAISLSGLRRQRHLAASAFWELQS